LRVKIIDDETKRKVLAMRVLILIADDFQDNELLVPYYRLKEEGILII